MNDGETLADLDQRLRAEAAQRNAPPVDARTLDHAAYHAARGALLRPATPRPHGPVLAGKIASQMTPLEYSQAVAQLRGGYRR